MQVATDYQSPLDQCSLFAPKDGQHCRYCHNDLNGRQTSWCSKECSDTYANNHYWQFARFAALRRDDRKCVRCGEGRGCEVNHIVPVVGQRQAGCQHHLDNLETLCHSCHVGVTAEQRKAGMLKRKAEVESL